MDNFIERASKPLSICKYFRIIACIIRNESQALSIIYVIMRTYSRKYHISRRASVSSDEHLMECIYCKTTIQWLHTSFRIIIESK